MPKKAPINESIDPVRRRLAAAAAADKPPMPVVASVEEGGNGHMREPKPAPAKPRRQPIHTSGPVHFTVNRKVMFTQDEADRNEEITRIIRRGFGSKVTYSQVTRAIWTVLASVEDAINDRTRRGGRLNVPSKGDHIAMAEYEQALSDYLAETLRRV